MIAYQFHGKIFYRVYKDVEAGTEFLVWYGEEYAGELGIALEKKVGNAEQGKCKGFYVGFQLDRIVGKAIQKLIFKLST